MSIRIISLLIILSLSMCVEHARAQFSDSLQLRIGTTVTVATQDHQPLWLVSNRFGTITDQQADNSTHISFANRHVYKGGTPLYDYLRKYEKLPVVVLEYGLDLYHNDHFQQVFIQEGYAKFTYNHWQLRAGRYEEYIGEINPELSSGAFGISGNALPVPKVSLALFQYTDVPLTNGWLQVKGLFSHGWMGEDRWVKGALLHEKNIYLRVGTPAFRLYGGLNRFALWGGQHPDYGQLPSTLNDYKIIVLGRPVDDARPYREEMHDRRGNHLGFFDFGFTLDLYDLQINVYQQTPFEDQSGVKPLANPDRLLGLGVALANQNPGALFAALTVEFMDTRYQGGSGSVGKDNYFNNRLYGSGWTYADRIIGTPLFTDRTRAAAYFDEDVVGADRWQVVNNKIRGVHLGWKGYLLPALQLRTLLTYTENYGNNFNKGQFSPHKTQWYFMQEVVYHYQHWRLQAALGIDAGELTRNRGLLFGVSYDLKNGFPLKRPRAPFP